MAAKGDIGLKKVAVPLALLLIGLFGYNALFGNAAAEAIAPADRELAALGGTRICTIGDGGHFINPQPWAEVYFLFNDSEELSIEDVASTVRQTLNHAGYERVEGPEPTDTAPYGVEKHHSIDTETYERYEGFDDGRQVVVTYSLAPRAYIFCHEDWGRVQAVSSTQAVVHVQLSLPSRYE